MEIQKIEGEIRELQNRLTAKKKELEHIQRNCDHHFKGNLHYETCIKCNKVYVHYY